MILIEEQIKKLIEEKPHRRELDRARFHQNRLRFHTETELLKNELSPYVNDYIAWICCEKPEILPKDKVARFKQLLTCPLPTIQLTESIGIALSRVFEGQDAFDRYDFDNPEKLIDWTEFRDDEFWRQDGFQAMLNAIDSVWIVDLPEEQEGDKPEPKDQLVNINNVIDLSVDKNGECQYLIFKTNNKLFVYDEVTISKYEYEKEELGALISQFTHELGYCPARMLWSELLRSDNFINHKSPLTNVLSELDWLLTHKVFKKYMDVANSFPILVKYKSGGDFEDFTKEINKARTEGEQKTAGSKLVGPGSVVEVPIPMEGQPDLMSNPLAWVSPPVEALQFHVTEDERLTDYIYKTSVGIEGEQNNDQAKNEKQVLASFENQTTILRRIATNFEKIQAFADKVKIQLRYGEEIEPSIDYGSKFFLKTAEDLITERESLISDDVMLDANSTELIETKFRNDSGGKIRAKVINDLDPLPSKTIDDLIKIKDSIDDFVFWQKITLMANVRRFEREQQAIALWMKVGDYSERVDLIKKEFKKYYNELEPKETITPIATAQVNQVTEPIELEDKTLPKRKQVK